MFAGLGHEPLCVSWVEERGGPFRKAAWGERGCEGRRGIGNPPKALLGATWHLQSIYRSFGQFIPKKEKASLLLPVPPACLFWVQNSLL